MSNSFYYMARARESACKKPLKTAGISPSQVQRIRDYARQLGRL